MGWAEHIVSPRRSEKCKQNLIRIHKVKRPLWRTRFKWEEKIKIDLKEIRYMDVSGIHLI
jgi:hypothetical protein